ncbi:hypothetical protein RBB50_001380 [Rhinocladiella similis]
MVASTGPTAIFHRSFTKNYDTAAGGKGVYIIGPDGRRTLDGSSGAAVSCLGHGHPTIIEAIVQQARTMAYAHSSFFTSSPAEELAHLLCSLSNGVFTKLLVLSSGSEAVESAIKIARQYHFARGETQRVNYISREFSYHGNSIGALSAGYHPQRREAFVPLLSPAFHHVSPCFFSRDAREDEDEHAYVERLIAEYEAMFENLGPDTVAAVLVEPVSGATLGGVPAATGYLTRLRQLCDKHGSLLIFDEVMCGMGRIGTLHAWQSLGEVTPDIQTIGKGLGAGYQPISGVLVSGKIEEAFRLGQDKAPFLSGHTYQDHSIACAAALATQRTIQEEGLLDNVQLMGERLEKRLKATVPMLKEVRGLGLFRAVEFKTSSTSPLAADVASACLKNGAAVYLCSSAVDAILFAPPYIINEQEIDHLVDIFVESVKEVLEARGSEST